MARKKINSVRAAIDNLREYIQELSPRKAIESRDKRTLKSTRGEVQKLSEGFTPSQIAAELGISRQKWVAIRGGIEKGKYYSPELRDTLRESREKLNESPYLETIKQKIHLKGESPKWVESEIWNIPSQGWINKNIPWAVNLKPNGFASGESAQNWLMGAGVGAEYFSITRKEIRPGVYRYFVMDIRTAAERGKKGTIGTKELRAEKIMQKSRKKK